MVRFLNGQEYESAQEGEEEVVTVRRHRRFSLRPIILQPGRMGNRHVNANGIIHR